ncbi:2OG-Fe(II) oxygenase [Sphingomonas sp.]|uniref:2OG-Fe(II) oxygenase n=1 Tax=Sphingomonas sp. TaxID=28214 RepID=UPI0035BBA44E
MTESATVATADDCVTQAARLAGAGRVRDAEQSLLAGARAGNLAAAMQLAVWNLVGHPLPRNLPQARQILRQAAAGGHLDAALMEVALTANGSGGPADWRAALALLATAARSDDMARRQLELLTKMDLDAAGAPRTMPAAERLSAAPDVVRYHRLLSPAECAHVTAAVHDLLEPSYVVDPQSGRHVAHPIRTSDGAVIGPTREDLVIRAINRRIAAISDTDIDQGEALSVLRYRPPQQFRMHHDAIGGVANQRVKTVLVYLNDGFAGGETYFPAADLTISPAQGDAVLFVNADAAGLPDPLANHAGLPVRAGVKWLATRWIRAHPIDPWNLAGTAN